METGCRYVGSTSWSFAKRWAKHRRDLAAGKHHAPRLQHSWNKYGPDAFAFRVLEACNPDDVVTREQWWMDQLDPEFNTAKIAYSCRGVRRTPEQRERYAAAARKRHAEGRGATHGIVTWVKSEDHRRHASEKMQVHQRERQRLANIARRKQAVRYDVGGEMLSVAEIVSRFGLNRYTIYDRIARGDRGAHLVRSV